MTDKPMELIYSQQAGDFIKGRAYSNPRFFSTPRAGVTKVLLVGDWPKIRAAYEALGVPVEQMGADDATGSPLDGSEGAKALTPTVDVAERSKVYIPDDWAGLPWSKPTDAGLTLRGLAAVFADEPVINKAQATAAIEAELARRATDA